MCAAKRKPESESQDLAKLLARRNADLPAQSGRERSSVRFGDRQGHCGSSGSAALPYRAAQGSVGRAHPHAGRTYGDASLTPRRIDADQSDRRSRVNVCFSIPTNCRKRLRPRCSHEAARGASGLGPSLSARHCSIGRRNLCRPLSHLASATAVHDRVDLALELIAFFRTGKRRKACRFWCSSFEGRSGRCSGRCRRCPGRQRAAGA